MHPRQRQIGDGQTVLGTKMGQIRTNPDLS
uniref:Uncharacterized protein n=1 Tax=Leersia perrieri TaxID=77586 RepID=A0A0D9XU52_9ORYZ